MLFTVAGPCTRSSGWWPARPILEEENSVASAHKSNKAYACKLDHETGEIAHLDAMAKTLAMSTQAGRRPRRSAERRTWRL